MRMPFTSANRSSIFTSCARTGSATSAANPIAKSFIAISFVWNGAIGHDQDRRRKGGAPESGVRYHRTMKLEGIAAFLAIVEAGTVGGGGGARNPSQTRLSERPPQPLRPPGA